VRNTDLSLLMHSRSVRQRRTLKHQICETFWSECTSKEKSPEPDTPQSLKLISRFNRPLRSSRPAARQRSLSPDQYEIVEVRTSHGMSRAMLFSQAILLAEWQADAPFREAMAIKRERWRAKRAQERLAASARPSSGGQPETVVLPRSLRGLLADPLRVAQVATPR
jgi:hypothetical protein